MIKTILTTTAIAMIGLTALVSGAEARPASVTCRELDDGWTICIKPVGSNSINMVVNNPYIREGFRATRNCSTGRVRWVDNDGFTKNEIVDLSKLACNF